MDIEVSASLKADQRHCCLLFGYLLVQVSSDFCILVHHTCNHLSDSGSGEGGISESSSCLPNLSLMGNLLTAKVSRQGSGQGPETLIFICCYLRPDT